MTVPETLFADAEFKANRVSGYCGCNTFDARYRAGGRTLFIARAGTTFMACSRRGQRLRVGVPRGAWRPAASTASDGAR